MQRRRNIRLILAVIVPSIAVLAACLVLASCVPAVSENAPSAINGITSGILVETYKTETFNHYRITDTKNNIVCYTYAQAISCVKVK